MCLLGTVGPPWLFRKDFYANRERGSRFIYLSKLRHASCMFILYASLPCADVAHANYLFCFVCFFVLMNSRV